MPKVFKVKLDYKIDKKELLRRVNASEEALAIISKYRLNKNKIVDILSHVNRQIMRPDVRYMLNYISLYEHADKILKVCKKAQEYTEEYISPMAGYPLNQPMLSFKVDCQPHAFIRELEKISKELQRVKDFWENYKAILHYKKQYGMILKDEGTYKFLKILMALIEYLYSKNIKKPIDIAKIAEAVAPCAFPENSNILYADNIIKLMKRHKVIKCMEMVIESRNSSPDTRMQDINFSILMIQNRMEDAVRRLLS